MTDLTLTDKELESQLNDMESDIVERKASISDSSSIKHSICAFANDLPGHGRPGVIFVGVQNDGSCAGLDITDGILLKLSEMRSSGQILPIPSMAVQKRTVDGCDIAVVVVAPSSEPPVRCDGKAYVRVGPSVRLASRDDERILTERRRSADLPFDHKRVDGATLEDLDLGFFRSTYLRAAVAEEVLEQNARPLELQLSSLRFLSARQYPNNGAIIVLGKDPLQFIPAAHIQFVRFDGTGVTSPIKDEKDLSGPLYEILPKLDDLLDINISTSVDVLGGSMETKTPDYPVSALRQLVRNAIMHRTYEGTNAPIRIYWFSDRIEMHNPGGLYGQVNEGNFGKGATDYRNPIVAEAMRVMGYVQRFGIGIPIAKEELGKNGNPPPEFEFQINSFLATVRKRA